MGKKIVGIISFMNPAGAQEAILRLMTQLRLRGHDTEVWFLYAKSSCYRGLPGVRVVLDKPRLSPLDVVRLFIRLLALMRTVKPDAAVAFLPLATVLGLTTAMLAGVKTRIASQRSPGPTFGALLRRLDRMVGSRGVYSRVVCVSESVRESFATYPLSYRERMMVVHNGIVWTPSGLEKAVARAGFGIPDDHPLMVATGRFVVQKNYDLMVRAMATTPRLRLAIAGDGPLYAATRALAQDLGAADRCRLAGRELSPGPPLGARLRPAAEDLGRGFAARRRGAEGRQVAGPAQRAERCRLPHRQPFGQSRQADLARHGLSSPRRRLRGGARLPRQAPGAQPSEVQRAESDPHL